MRRNSDRPAYVATRHDKAEAYLKGKDAESEEAQEHANNSSQNRR